MTTYYVKPTGNDTTGDGSDGTPWATPGKAAAEMGDNDICYVLKGTYTMTSASAGAGGPIAFASGIHVKMIGYESTIADGCPTGDRPELNASTYDPAQMVSMNGDFDDGQLLANFNINGNSRGINGVVGNTSGHRYNRIVNCLIQHCDGTYGARLITAVQTKVYSCAAVGFSDCRSISCWADANEDGFDSSAAEYYAVNCIASNGTIGFDMAAYSGLVNCTSYNNSSDGFEGAYCDTFVNCVSVSDSAYAFDSNADTVMVNCAHYNTASGRTSTAPQIDIGAITLSGVPFVNAGSGDFTPDTTASEGVLLRSAGIDPYGQTGYLDIGAVQHADPAAADVRYGVATGASTGTLQIPNSDSPTGTEDETSDACVVSGKKYGSTPRTGTAAGGGGGGGARIIGG